jgi:hypothetical protein
MLASSHLSCPGPNAAPGPTGPGRTFAAWPLLTVECPGCDEVAVERDGPLELTGRDVLSDGAGIDVAVVGERVTWGLVPLRAGARCTTRRGCDRADLRTPTCFGVVTCGTPTAPRS